MYEFLPSVFVDYIFWRWMRVKIYNLKYKWVIRSHLEFGNDKILRLVGGGKQAITEQYWIGLSEVSNWKKVIWFHMFELCINIVPKVNENQSVCALKSNISKWTSSQQLFWWQFSVHRWVKESKITEKSKCSSYQFIIIYWMICTGPRSVFTRKIIVPRSRPSNQPRISCSST